MILIDLGIFALFMLFAIVGYHKGFFKAILNTVTFFISLLGAWWLHPQLAQTFKASGQIIPILINYSDSSEMLGAVENVRSVATSLAPEALNDIIAKSNLAHPLGTLLAENVGATAFAQDGVVTLGDYLSMTIANMTLNIISFIIIFLIFYIAFNILIGLYDYVFKLPVLKLFDSVAGTLLGFVQGFLMMFLIFSIIPVILAFLQFNEIIVFLEDSQLGRFYFHSNFIIDMIKGTIT
ncbi:MAG: CvpA family protein [Clostridiales bacterium]|nr:CvpA family protein [Clostridiales bacterium]